jgi:multicomponent Na+:H+ antiporter subunit E
MRITAMFVVLCVVWLLWSGSFDPVLLGFGLISAALSLILAIRMGCFAQEVLALHLIPHLPGYALFLFGELVKSSVYVAKIVLSPRMRISPMLTEIDVSTMNTVGIAVLGNSITLTPNTATVNIENSKMQVHCLTAYAAADLAQSGIQERVQRLIAASTRQPRTTDTDRPSC